MDDNSFTQGVLDFLVRRGPLTTDQLKEVFLEKGEGIHPFKAQVDFAARTAKLQKEGFIASEPRLPGPETQFFYERSSVHEITQKGREKLHEIKAANASRAFGAQHIASLFPQSSAIANTNGNGSGHAHAPVTPLNCHVGARRKKETTAAATL